MLPQVLTVVGPVVTVLLGRPGLLVVVVVERPGLLVVVVVEPAF